MDNDNVDDCFEYNRINWRSIVIGRNGLEYSNGLVEILSGASVCVDERGKMTTDKLDIGVCLKILENLFHSWQIYRFQGSISIQEQLYAISNMTNERERQINVPCMYKPTVLHQLPKACCSSIMSLSDYALLS